MIKVEHTRILELNRQSDGWHWSGCSVTDAKLMLIRAEKHELFGRNWIHVNRYNHYPILISESEKIEDGDWVYDTEAKYVRKLNSIHNQTDFDVKILALSEHFSPEQLQMIVDGKLKDGDRVLVECEINFSQRANDDGVKIGFPYSDGNQIKLNPHITIYPPVEEKMYTKKEIANYIQQFSEAAMTHGSSFNGRLFLTNWDQWFEQNVK